jgi:hypothetical protein
MTARDVSSQMALDGIYGPSYGTLSIEPFAKGAAACPSPPSPRDAPASDPHSPGLRAVPAASSLSVPLLKVDAQAVAVDPTPLLSLTVSALGLCAGSVAAATIHASGAAGARALGDCIGGGASLVGALVVAVVPGPLGSATRFAIIAGGAVAARGTRGAIEASAELLSLGVGVGVAVAVTGGGRAALLAARALAAALARSAAQGEGHGDARAWAGAPDLLCDPNCFTACALLLLGADGRVIGLAREGEGGGPPTPYRLPRPDDAQHHHHHRHHRNAKKALQALQPPSPSAPPHGGDDPTDFDCISEADAQPELPAPWVLLPLPPRGAGSSAPHE